MSDAILLLIGCVALGLAVLFCYSEYLSNRLDVQIVRTTPENDTSDLYPFVIRFRHGMTGFTFYENLIPWFRDLTMFELHGMLGTSVPLPSSIDGHHEIRGPNRVICFMQQREANEFAERVTRLCRSRVDRKPFRVVHSSSCDLRVGECARDEDYATTTKHQRQMQHADNAIQTYQSWNKL